MATQPQTEPSPAPAPGGAQPQQAQGLNPQQIQQMQTMVKQAMGLLLEEQTADTIVAKAQQGNPQRMVTDLAVDLMGKLYEAATQAGQQIDMVTLMVTGLQIIGTLTEMLVAGGVLTEQDAPQFVAGVSKMAIQKHNQAVQSGQMGQAQAAPPQQPPGAPAGGMMGSAQQGA